MARIRNTARWGNSDVIMLKPQDKTDMDIDIGNDKVDIDDMIILKPNTDKDSCRRDKNDQNGTALMPYSQSSEQSKAGVQRTPSTTQGDKK